jgi:hypothetical protein
VSQPERLLMRFLAVLLGLYAAVDLYLGRPAHSPDTVTAMVLAAITGVVRRAIRP